MRTREWYHELSDQENNDEIDRIVGDEPQSAPPRHGAQRARVPTTEIERWINQFREELRNHAVDGNTITHRFQQFLEEHQRREENSRAMLDQRLAHFRDEYIETMRKTTMSFIKSVKSLKAEEQQIRATS